MTQPTSLTTSKSWVQALLAEPVLARLGTCNPKTMQPHVTPVWFEWDGQVLWISAFRSTRKIREVLANPKISVVIDTDARGQPALGVLMEGTAELVSDPALVAPRATSIYTRYLGSEGVLDTAPQSWIYDPENMIIKLTPERVWAWGGDG